MIVVNGGWVCMCVFALFCLWARSVSSCLLDFVWEKRNKILKEVARLNVTNRNRMHHDFRVQNLTKCCQQSMWNSIHSFGIVRIFRMFEMTQWQFVKIFRVIVVFHLSTNYIMKGAWRVIRSFQRSVYVGRFPIKIKNNTHSYTYIIHIPNGSLDVTNFGGFIAAFVVV